MEAQEIRTQASVEQKKIVEQWRLIQAHLMSLPEPTPELSMFLLNKLRIEVAEKLHSAATYLQRLTSDRELNPNELGRTANVHDRIRAEQSELVSTVGVTQ